jgi:hypothetical protein
MQVKGASSHYCSSYIDSFHGMPYTTDFESEADFIFRVFPSERQNVSSTSEASILRQKPTEPTKQVSSRYYCLCHEQCLSWTVLAASFLSSRLCGEILDKSLWWALSFRYSPQVWDGTLGAWS